MFLLAYYVTYFIFVYSLLGRPNVSSEGLMFCCRCFFYSPGYLRAPSADRRETLPHDRNVFALDNASPKIRGALPPKKLGAKNMQNSVRFQGTSNFDSEYLRNGTRYPKSESNVIISDPSRVPPKKSGELWSTNYRELCEFEPTQIAFFRCWPLKF